MGRLLSLFRTQAVQPKERPQHTDLAFLLLSDTRLPSADAVIGTFSRFEPGGKIVQLAPDNDSPARHEILSFSFASGESAFVALMPVPVPGGEAEQGAKYSVGSLGTGWTLPPHSAHLVVTAQAPSSMSLVARVSRFTSLLAAVAETSGAVGVYWGNARATHSADFFTSVAADQGITARIMLWTGLSVAHESDGRSSLLSLGMQQLDLPDLLLVSSSPSNEALETFFDLLAYVASRGEPIPEGETVGRTADEKAPVHYVRSPVDAGKKVWRVDLS